jgi:subtilisin
MDVVSAGNYGKDASLISPANNPNMLTVSAIADSDSDGVCGAVGPNIVLSDDSFAFSSNLGPVVKIAAPGKHTFNIQWQWLCRR